MINRSRCTARVGILLGGLVLAALALPATPATSASSVTTLIDGLNGPRGLDVGPRGRIAVSEGDGTISAIRDGRRLSLGQVPAGFIAPAVAIGPASRVWVLTPEGAPGTGAATLYRLRQDRTAVAVADIAAYQHTDPDPYDLEDEPGASNPFGLAALADGSVLVADAGGNDLLRVWPDGSIVTVARLKPRTVAVPPGLPTQIDGRPVPPAGTQIPSEAVATSVTVGADGSYYVGELRGFPATPGTSQVWRIAPGSVGAVCDPAAPSTGGCQRYADGFTSVVDLGAGPHGSIDVVELVQQSWLQWELGLVDPPLGGVFRIHPDKTVTEVAPGSFVLPGGTELSRGGKPLVVGPVFGPGALWRVNG